MHNLAVTGGSINNRSAACHDSDMAAYNNDITSTQIGETADSGVSAGTSPTRGGHITLTHANLI